MKLYHVIEKIQNLDKKTRKIILITMIIIVLSIGIRILKNRSSEVDWNFKGFYKEKDIEKYVSNLEKEQDRQIYWTLYSIIDKYIETNTQEINSDKFENEQYDILLNAYKKKIDLNEYNILRNDFVNRFVDGNKEKYPFYIENIYLCDKGIYLCHVKVDTSSMSEHQFEAYYTNFESEDVVYEIKKEGYIGIKLDSYKSIYEIFYIE